VPIGPVPVAPAVAEWPQVLLDQPTFDAPPGLSGTLHVRFGFPAGTDVRAETFDLVNSELSCGGGNAVMNLTASNVAPGDVLSFPVDRVTYNGPCTVTVQLTQNAATATGPPLYGAGPSKAVTSGTVQVDVPSLTSTAGDFAAMWSGTNGHPTVVVSYHGADDLGAGAANWQMTVSNGTSTCGSADGNPPPATIAVDNGCVQTGGTFTVGIDFSYFGVAHAHFDVPVGGDAPSPVDPAKISFTAAWNNDPALPQVDLTYTGSADLAQLAPLDWTETVTSSASPGVTCGRGTANPADSPPRIDVDLSACPSQVGNAAAVYTVEITFTDPDYGRTGDYTYQVQGSPPS
jgi:hypothetical protein